MKTYTTMDKSTWGPGEWQDEPDKLSWTDEETGLPCLIVRNRGGALCGYVGVDPSHPWHRVEYGEHIGPSCGEDWCYEHTPEGVVSVHGGLTYSAGCQHSASEDSGICHIPDPGQTDDVWWFGFDTAHSGDYCPAHSALGDVFTQREWETYRNVDYVRTEVAGLARQLVEVASP